MIPHQTSSTTCKFKHFCGTDEEKEFNGSVRRGVFVRITYFMGCLSRSSHISSASSWRIATCALVEQLWPGGMSAHCHALVNQGRTSATSLICGPLTDLMTGYIFHRLPQSRLPEGLRFPCRNSSFSCALSLNDLFVTCRNVVFLFSF